MENSRKGKKRQTKLLFTISWFNNSSLVEVFFHILGYLSLPGINQTESIFCAHKK